jgi:uncharacterized membrane protein YobD (UPF0266 family)
MSNLIVAILLAFDLRRRKSFLIWIILVALLSKELGVIFALIYLAYNKMTEKSLYQEK